MTYQENFSIKPATRLHFYKSSIFSGTDTNYTVIYIILIQFAYLLPQPAAINEKNMKTKLMREITPLTQNDCFTIFSRVKTEFDFPFSRNNVGDELFGKISE